MTEEQINRVIAESLEPEPQYKPSMRISGVAQDIDGQLSKLNSWRYVIHQQGCEGCGWMPRDFIGDPSCTLMLIKELLKLEVDIHGCRIAERERV